MDEFKKGQKVYRRDPENETSGVYEVQEKTGWNTYLIGSGASEAEVYECELYPLSQKAVFRKHVRSGSISVLFPGQMLDECPEIVASYDFEDKRFDEADYDFVMNASHPVYEGEYAHLLPALEEEGYDNLEIEPSRMSRWEILQAMDIIARSLMVSYLTDFTEHDIAFLDNTNAEIPFVWLVRQSGTRIFRDDDGKEIRNLLETMDYYESAKTDFCLYRYDGVLLKPVFPSTVREWAKKEYDLQ
ncbi:hypothetical protein [Viscerimonas tarda]